MLTQRLYHIVTRSALPLARVYLRKRARKQPEYLEHWDERFGTVSYPAPRQGRPRLWLHAVSLGETLASRGLIETFLAEFPEADLLLTCMTPTGRDAGGRIARAYEEGRVQQCYLPYDTPELMGKFLDETRPTLGILMETEVWPNLIEQARLRGVDLILANARESEKSARQARRFGWLMHPAFAGFQTVLAQTEADASRLRLLGAKSVHVCGSVKFDIRPNEAQREEAKKVREAWGRPVILLASTRVGEEPQFLRAIAAEPVEPQANAVVVLVPRHPQRFDEVAEMIEAAGLSYVRRSSCADLAELADDVQVVLGDSLGEMSFYCALADVCIMGGSYGNFGSQNLIEPAAAGAPVLVGPSSFNFAKAVDDAVTIGGAERMRDAKQAWSSAKRWLIDGTLAERSRRAMQFAQTYTGATERQMEWIRDLWLKNLSATH